MYQKLMILIAEEEDDDALEALVLLAWAHEHQRPRRIRDHRPIGRPPRLGDFSENDIHLLFGFRDRSSLGSVMSALKLPEFVVCPKHRYKMEGEFR